MARYSAIISVSATVSKNIPIFALTGGVRRRYGLTDRQLIERSKRKFRFTLEVGIIDEDGMYPTYNPPRGKSKSLDDVIQYVRSKGFEPLKPLIDNARKIRKNVEKGMFQYMYSGGPSMKKLLELEGKYWVAVIKNYIRGFNSPPLSSKTLEIRKRKHKKFPSYYSYDMGITHPLVETGLMINSVTYRILELSDQEIKVSKKYYPRMRDDRESQVDSVNLPSASQRRRTDRKLQREAKKEKKKIKKAAEREHQREERFKKGAKEFTLTPDQKNAVVEELNFNMDMFMYDSSTQTIKIPGIGFKAGETREFTLDAIRNAENQISKIPASMFEVKNAMRKLSKLLEMGIFGKVIGK